MSKPKKPNMESRYTTHYDSLHKGPYGQGWTHGFGSCIEPEHCNCECSHCMKEWNQFMDKKRRHE